MPNLSPKDDLAQVAIDLAMKVDVKVDRSQILSVDRRSNGSSIAVYFTSNIVHSPLYLLKGREVFSKGRNLNMYFNTLLTPSDETLY